MPLWPDAPAIYHPAALVSTFEMIEGLDHVFTSSASSLDRVLEVSGSSSQNFKGKDLSALKQAT